MKAYHVYMRAWRDQPFRHFLWVGEGDFSPKVELDTYNGGIHWKRYEGEFKVLENTNIYPLIMQKTYPKDYIMQSEWVQIVEIPDEFLLTHPDKMIREWAFAKWKRENPT